MRPTSLTPTRIVCWTNIFHRWHRLWPYGAFLSVCAAALLPTSPPPGNVPHGVKAALPGDHATPCAAAEARWTFIRRNRAQTRIVQQVIAGQLTLLQAAERFRDLNEMDHEYRWDLFRRFVPGATDDERHCRQVIGYVAAWPGSQHEHVRAAAECARLEDELRACLRHGPVRLPQ